MDDERTDSPNSHTMDRPSRGNRDSTGQGDDRLASNGARDPERYTTKQEERM